MRKLLRRLSVAFATALTLSGATVLGVGCSEKKISDPQKFIDAIKEDPEVNISLSSDLDFTGFDWEPLAYNGILKGNGHTISNITIKKNEGDCIGIFSWGQLSVENLKIENLKIDYFGEDEYIGGLVGYWGRSNSRNFELPFDQYIKDVEISGTINALGAKNVGGVVGYQHCGDSTTDKNDEGASLNNVVSRIDVIGGSNVGGVVGLFQWEEDWAGLASTVDMWNLTENVKNYGSVTAVKEGAGGIVGCVNDLAVYEGCVNYGEVRAQMKAGGIAANTNLADFVGCSNEGRISSTGSPELVKEDFVGGIVGYQKNGRISQCTNKGEIVAKNDCSGGIAGCQETCKEILACTNTGVISGDWYVGGIVGALKGVEMLVSTCKNEGEIKGNMLIGGIVGGGSGSWRNILSDNDLVVNITSCENVGKIYCTNEYLGQIIGGCYVSDSRLENNTYNGELYVNGVLYKK